MTNIKKTIGRRFWFSIFNYIHIHIILSIHESELRRR